MPEFTAQQQGAIYARGSDLLVSAAAGSGKTAVLVERIQQLLREGTDPSALLVVTFTQAAAAEMRERLRSALERLAEGEERLQHALDRLPLASISTIHAFCKQLLDAHFDRVGLEPGFQVASEDTSQMILSRALEDTLDQIYLDDDWTNALAPVGDMDKLRLEIKRLYVFLMSQRAPEDWLENALARYETACADPDGADSPWRQELDLTGNRLLQEAADRVRQALSLCGQIGSRYMETVKDDLIRIEAARADRQSSIEFARLPSIRSKDKTEEDERVKALRDGYRKLAQEGLKYLKPTDAQEQKELVFMAAPLRALGRATLLFAETYAAQKREEACVDFSDLEQFALKLLEDEQILDEVRERFEHVFVDEYQDSSAVQEAILSRVARPGTRFLVGDVKQSIYRFRQAEPDIFLSHAERFAKGQGGRLLTINRNFRSNAGILQAVNFVFSACMQGGDAEIVYDDAAALYPGLDKGAPNPVRLSLAVLKNEEGEADIEGQEISRARAEALNAARLVHDCLGLPIRREDGSSYPADFRDIVLLLRSPRRLISIFQETLAAQGIPVYAEAGGEYFDTWEVRAALDYLTALDNPRKDVPLLGALRGLGGFSAEELARIRLMGTGLSWYSCLKLYIDRGEDKELREKLRVFCDRLYQHRQRSVSGGVSELLIQVLEETGFVQRCLGLPHGKTRQANLQALCLHAAAFDAPQTNLSDFLRQSAFSSRRGREGDTPTLTERDNVVRILSVHKSKGLQFPIVIGCGLARAFNFGTEKDEETGIGSTLQLDAQLGLGLDFFDPAERVHAQTIATRAILEKKRRQEIAEEMRILYVLMTRPTDYLVLSGVVNDAYACADEWAAAKNSRARCMLDWIARPLMRHPDAEKLRAYCTLPPDAHQERSRWQIEWVFADELMRQEQEERIERLPQLLAELAESAQSVPQNPFAPVLPLETMQAENAPQKQSVLQSIHWGERDVDFIHSRPAFLQSLRKELTPTEKGSAMHEAMRMLELAPLRGKDEQGLRDAICRQMDALLQQGRLNAQQRAAIEEDKLCRFFLCPIGQAMLGSKQVRREQSFVRREENGGLVQGIIDLCFETENGWVLVDYKTDRNGLKNEEVIARHGAQIEKYAQAMEGAGLCVCKKAVFLFAVSRAVYL